MSLLAAVFVLALSPYPVQHAGAGQEPTRVVAIFAGTAFVARSALVNYEIGKSCCPAKSVGNVNVFVFERAGITCAILESAKSARFFSYTVETDGKRLPVGRAPSSAFFQQASFNIVGLTTGFQPGVSIMFTRIDTATGALWHGRVTVPRQTYNKKLFAFNGTFAARWCGTKTG